jgi:hypothetical protein
LGTFLSFLITVYYLYINIKYRKEYGEDALIKKILDSCDNYTTDHIKIVNQIERKKPDTSL